MAMFFCEGHQQWEDIDYVGYNCADLRHAYCDEAWSELYPDPTTVHGITFGAPTTPHCKEQA